MQGLPEIVSNIPDWQSFYKQLEGLNLQVAAPTAFTLACDRCEKSSATIYCPQDRAHFCDYCDSAHHQSSKLLIKHQRLPLYHSPFQFGFCSLHPAERYESVCLDCGELVCRICLLAGSHAELTNHKIIGTIEAFQMSQNGSATTHLTEMHGKLLKGLQTRHKELGGVKANSEEVGETLEKQLRAVVGGVDAQGSAKINVLQAVKRQALLRLLTLEWSESFLVHMRLSLGIESWLRRGRTWFGGEGDISESAKWWFIFGRDEKADERDLPAWLSSPINVIGALDVGIVNRQFSNLSGSGLETVEWSNPLEFPGFNETGAGLVLAERATARGKKGNTYPGEENRRIVEKISPSDSQLQAFSAFTAAAIDEASAVALGGAGGVGGVVGAGAVGVAGGIRGMGGLREVGWGVGGAAVQGLPGFGGSQFSLSPGHPLIEDSPRYSSAATVPPSSPHAGYYDSVGPLPPTPLRETLAGGALPYENALQLVKSCGVSERPSLLRGILGVVGGQGAEIFVKRLIREGVQSASLPHLVISAPSLAASLLSVFSGYLNFLGPALEPILKQSEISSDAEALQAIRGLVRSILSNAYDIKGRGDGRGSIPGELRFILRTVADEASLKFHSSVVGWGVAGACFAARVVSPALIRAGSQSGGSLSPHISLLSKQLQRIGHAEEGARDVDIAENFTAFREFVKDQSGGDVYPLSEGFVRGLTADPEALVMEYVRKYGGLV